MTYIQVNIGRNVGTTPMSDTDWDTFADEVAFAIYHSANRREAFSTIDNIELHNGTGVYDGISEDSRHISSFWEDGFDLDQLRTMLRDTRVVYGQDAIALIVGSELI